MTEIKIDDVLVINQEENDLEITPPNNRGLKSVEKVDHPVDHPPHYTFGGIEAIDMIESAGYLEDFCAANIMKYIIRYRHKNGLEDVKKVRWYVNKLIEYLEKQHTV